MYEQCARQGAVRCIMVGADRRGKGTMPDSKVGGNRPGEEFSQRRGKLTWKKNAGSKKAVSASHGKAGLPRCG